MKIYGSGVLTAPGTGRVIWDFVDGIFESTNPQVIDAAKLAGCWIGEEAEKAFSISKAPVLIAPQGPPAEEGKPDTPEADRFFPDEAPVKKTRAKKAIE
jgi:hypothetical protein